MNRTIQFELRAYPADEFGAFKTAGPIVSIETVRDMSAAKRRAGQSAKRVNGPVDIAYAGDEPWNERYLTTAAPSEYHTSGYRFGRLA